MNPHTPGPWEWVGSFYIESPSGTVLACSDDGKPYGLHSATLEISDADRRLIAAAPRLLKACQQALYALKGREHDGFLRDAIKEATGAETLNETAVRPLA